MTEHTLLPAQPIIDWASVVVLDNPIKQTVKNTFNVCPGTTVAQWLVESGYDIEIRKQPILLLLNSEPLLEADFDTPLNAGDILTLVPQPAVLPVLPAWALWTAFAVTAVSTAYSIYLALTLDTGLDDSDDRSQNTKIGYRGNHARQGSARPQAFGTMRVLPDLAAQPYSVYDEAGDQIAYMLLEVTEGQADCSEHEFNGTSLDLFEDPQIEVLQPGEPSTIFPDSVYVNDSVSNLTLTPTRTAPFVVCDVGEAVSEVQLDFIAPEGVYIINSLGKYKYHQVAIRIEFRTAGSAEEPHILEELVTETWNPRRFTVRVPFTGVEPWRPPGRYEFTCHRTVADVGDSKTMEKVVWTGLRGFVPATTEASSSTRIALAVRSSDQIATTALTKFSTLVKRKLPIWDGATWSAPQLTNSAVWAFCEVLKSSGKRTDAYIDLPGLKAIDDSMPEEFVFGEFNGVFDSTGTVKSACDEIAAVLVARAHEIQGNIYTMTLDREELTPTRMFTSRSILDGSFSLSHIFQGTPTTDSVDISYFDAAQDYREATIHCVPGESDGLKPKTMKLRGVTNWVSAAAVGMRMAAENRHRRDMIKFSTGIEGVLCKFGDTIRVQHYELGRLSSNAAVSGDIVAYNSGTITVLEDISAHVGGSPYCYLLNRDASPQGPYLCSVSGQDITIIDAFEPAEITFDDDLVRPTFAIGGVEDFMITMKITSVADGGARTMEITGFVDNVNAYHPGEDPVPTTLAPRQNTHPHITDLRHELFGESDNPYIKLTWTWENCDHAIIKSSLNNGQSWDYVGRAYEPSYLMVPPITGTLKLFVQGVGIIPGWPAVTGNIDTSAYTLSVPPITGLKQWGGFADEAIITWDAPRDLLRTKVTVYWNSEVRRQVVLDRTITDFKYSAYDAMIDGGSLWLPLSGARDLTFSLVAIASDNSVSATPATLDMKNNQVVSLQNVRFQERSADLIITYDLPADPDYLGCAVHVSQTHGFTPTEENLAHRSNSNNITIAGVLQPTSTYFVRVGAFDHWGFDEMVYSAEARVDTGDNVTSGDIVWDSILPSPGRPADYATFTGLISSVVDPRYDYSAAEGSLAPYWHASHPTQIALSLTGGADGGPGAIITGDNESHLKLYPANGAGYAERYPAYKGLRFQISVALKKSSGMGAAIEAAEMDKNNQVVYWGTTGNPDIIPVDTYTRVAGVYTIQHTNCRSVKFGISVGPGCPVGETLGIDDFQIYQIPPEITGDNIDDYIGEEGIDSRHLKTGSIFVTDAVDVAADSSETTLTIPATDNTWSEWYVIKTYTVSFLGRRDGQPLLLTYFSQDDLRITNTNTSEINDCQIQMQLVRVDADGGRTLIGIVTDDPFWPLDFKMPEGPPTFDEGVDWFQYGSLEFNPWSVHHHYPRRTDMVDTDPPNGLCTYEYRWRLKMGTGSGSTEVSKLTSLKQHPGKGRLQVMGSLF